MAIFNIYATTYQRVHIPMVKSMKISICSIHLNHLFVELPEGSWGVLHDLIKWPDGVALVAWDAGCCWSEFEDCAKNRRQTHMLGRSIGKQWETNGNMEI